MNKENKFTIFTPVYNGANHVHRVFESVRNTTYKNFEWIIINDGSSDNSKEVIEQLIATMDCDITFVNFEENRGKHRAWNHAASIATGELWLPIDCDDSFEPESVSFFNEKWNEVGGDDIYGIDVLVYRDTHDKIRGNAFPYDGFKSSYLEYTHRYRVKGEKWGCVRMDLIKRIPFPDIKANYFTGPYLWNNYSKEHYYVVCYNKPLRHHYYVETSIVNSNKTWNYYNFQMLVHYYKWFLPKCTTYLLRYDRPALYSKTKDFIRCSLISLFMRIIKAPKITRVDKL